MNEVVDAVVGVWGSQRVGIRLSPNGQYGERQGRRRIFACLRR